MSPFGPIVPSHGPSPSKLAFLAECPGDRESELLRPLVGPSGHELRRMLQTVGVDLNECWKGNVFSRQPSANNLQLYCSPDPATQHRALGPLVSNPLGYMDTLHLPDLERCYEELAALNPNVIVALGNTACWALGLGTGISALRGTVHSATIPGMSRPVKVVPTYHPASVLRQWDQRVVAIADLEKAHVESQSPHFSFDNTELWLNPTLQDLGDFDAQHMVHASVCACDIETKRSQISCISFAPSSAHSIVVPFWLDGASPHYWPTPEEEAIAWGFVRKWMEREDLIKIFQNGLFDLQHLQKRCSPRACTEDTMLQHHSLFSELQKGLGFLGSVYANTPSWKSLRNWAKKEELLKRDD